MKTSISELIWEPEPGLLGFSISIGKILVSLALAFAIHEGLLLIPPLILARETHTYEDLVSRTNDALKSNGINAKLCLYAPSGKEQCPALTDTSEARPTTWLSLTVTDKVGHTTFVPFIENERVAFVSNPKIVNSVHSLARIVEKAHQAEVEGGKEKNATSELRLCAGSIKILDDPTCTAINTTLLPIQKQLESDLAFVRIVCLIFGFIQYLVLAVFVYIWIESVGVAIRLFSPKNIFFEVVTTQTEPITSDIRLISEDRFPEAVKQYNATRYRSAGDRLVARILQTTLKPDPGQVANDTIAASNGSAVAEAFREYEISEPDGSLTTLDVANEAMLKLAFVGTIWGIGSALFLVRDLDSLDPVARIVTKSGMFAGIGTGFGTTMVGVLFSIVASLRIQAVSARWEELVNDYYRIIINTGVIKITSIARSLPVPPEPRRVKPIAPPKKRSIYQRLGLIFVIGVIGFFVWVFWSDIEGFIHNLVETNK